MPAGLQWWTVTRKRRKKFAVLEQVSVVVRLFRKPQRICCWAAFLPWPNVDHDENGVHSLFIYTLCWRVLSRYREAVTAGRSFFFSARRACAIPAVGCAHRHSECCVRAACCQWKANKEKEVSSFLRLRWCGSTAKSANITTSPLSSWCSASNHSSNTWVHRHWQRWSAENLRLASRRIAAAHWCRWPFLIFWQTQTP